MAALLAVAGYAGDGIARVEPDGSEFQVTPVTDYYHAYAAIGA